jgi:membrane-bound inhibitor of C-type lysozyme
MNGSVRFSSLQAALWSGVLLAGCAPQTDYSGVATSPIAMVCDGGRTFTIAYANNFETAIIETEGRRVELTKVRTSFGSTPTPAVPSVATDETAATAPSVVFAPTTGTTGVRYASDEALFISRNREAVLQVGDDTYSNCEVART